MNMESKKKILFLTPSYPFGVFGASTLCSYKVMREIALSDKYEVHCISFKGQKANYEIDPKVKLHVIPIATPKPSSSKYLIYLKYLLMLPIYPLSFPFLSYRVYKACISICEKYSFDLVIAQCFNECSYLPATLLKKFGHINHLGMIFWDNLYGKDPARFINSKFANYRNKRFESFIAKHADFLISLYPIKKFHEENGDLPAAVGKRHYLGIPSVIRPCQKVFTKHSSVIVKGKINVLYSGTIIKSDFIEDAIRIFNQSSVAEIINLIFFSRGMSDAEFDLLRGRFKGTIVSSDYISIQELHSIYHDVDCFLSVPGDPNSVRSKIFEYVSFGHPVIILYQEDYDVNISTFGNYPLALSLDIRDSEDNIARKLDLFFQSKLGKHIPFEEVEELFQQDTPTAYVQLIELMLASSVNGQR